MRPVLLALGTLALAALWLGPLPSLARRAFSAHMTMHMGVVAVAAPLLALGVACSPFDPVRKAPRLFVPVPASVLELAVVWAWHAPVLHRAARHDAAGLAAEQGTFLLSGLLVWLSAFGGGPARGGNRTGAGVLGLLLTSMHMTLLGALLALTPRPLYRHDDDLGDFASLGDPGFVAALCRFPGFPVDRPFGLTPLEDQHLGGAIMLLVGGASYLLGGLWLTAGLLRDATAETGGRT